MTDFEKLIYNLFQKTTRSKSNLPYNFRKDFEGFEDGNDYVFVKKLAIFFGKFNHINIKDFFEAPFVVYPDEKYLPLQFFTTRKAIKAYQIFKNKKQDDSPDSDEQIEDIKKSLIFIAKFCSKHKIPIQQYALAVNGIMPVCLLHLRERKINAYVLFGFKDFDKTLSRVPRAELQFIIGQFYDKIDTFRTRYFNSVRARSIVEKGLEQLEKIKITS